ncbi:alpha-glucosidase [Amylocystis lapponica]|nr:alpha-glucosidase [Amylocystis lapponica]
MDFVETRIHLKITDASATRYEVPESVLPRPQANASTNPDTAAIHFNYTSSPFTFSIYRSSTSEILFSTASHPLIYEPQYLHVRTSLSADANIYGLGEHTEDFRLPTENLTRTLWSRDAYGVPNGTNLYGNHPIYFEHRITGTHGVFLLNSNGMDIKINSTVGAGTTLEYDVIGGSSICTSWREAKQIQQRSLGSMPRWSGHPQKCRIGRSVCISADFVDVAGVISNYSAAEIPLETMWTDIVTMNDPAVAYVPDQGYTAFDRGSAANVWLKAENGSDFLGVVWPDPFGQAAAQGLPPRRTTIPPDIDTPIFVNSTSGSSAVVRKRDGQSGLDVLNPPYAIANAAGDLSNRTSYTNVMHANGMMEYNTRQSASLFSPASDNLFGTMMSTITHNAMLARRPGLRTLVVTRSTFAGAGRYVQKWLGDNFSDWPHYTNSIAGILNMASVFHVPMAGADICGYAEDTTETLCARWAMLGAFYPFMRNHNSLGNINQEFYRWPVVAEAARNALDMRYRLIDYFYTAFHRAHVDGTPVLNPLWYKYPQDPNTFGIDLQFLFGDSILVSPVTETNATSVSAYFPDDVFYDFATLAPVQGHGSTVLLDNVNLTTIPVHIRGGAVLPLRVQGAMTTTALRDRDFELVVAPGRDGAASGTLYVDDGVSIAPNATTEVSMVYKNGILMVSGTFGYNVGVNVARVRVLGVAHAPSSVELDGESVNGAMAYDVGGGVVDVPLGIPFNRNFTLQVL